MAKKNDEKNENLIPIFGRQDGDRDNKGERSIIGFFKKPSETAYGSGEIDASVLKKRVVRLLEQMQNLIDDAPSEKGKFQVETITFSVEISAKGSVSLLGTGGEVGGKGGVTVTLKRSKASE